VSNLPGYDIVRPVDLTSTGHPMPVIVWADGGCVRYDTVWLPILKRWAASGYVVVAITTPPGADPRKTPPSTIDDQARAITWATQENSQPTSPFYRHLDAQKIVAAGNSCGGVTALDLAARDKRVRAVFVLSGSSVLPGSPKAAAAKIMNAIHVPVGYVFGGPQDISSYWAHQDFSFIPTNQLAMLAHRASGDHLFISTNKTALAEDAEISTEWIDYALTRNPQTKQVLLHHPCSTCAPGTWTLEFKGAAGT
jgi:dienelactone hydrolase